MENTMQKIATLYLKNCPSLLILKLKIQIFQENQKTKIVYETLHFLWALPCMCHKCDMQVQHVVSIFFNQIFVLFLDFCIFLYLYWYCISKKWATVIGGVLTFRSHTRRTNTHIDLFLSFTCVTYQRLI